MEYYPEYSENDFRLYHHGILGMNWGQRNGPPYPLNASDHSASERKAGWRKSLSDARAARKEKREEKKRRKNYDYRESDNYKNANARKKAALERQHNTNRALYGKRGASRFEYDTQVRGLSSKEARSNELKRKAKTVAAITAIGTAGTFLTTQIIGKGVDLYAAGKAMAKLSNAAVDAYAKARGLNSIKGGFTMGGKAVSQGIQLARKYGL